MPEDVYSAFALSADGLRLAYGRGAEIWVWNRVRQTATRLTPRSTGGTAPLYQWPRWTPDGQAVLYQSKEPGAPPRLMSSSVDGSTIELVGPDQIRPTSLLYPMGFSPDGSALSFFARAESSSFDLYLLPLAGSRASSARAAAHVFLQTPFGETFGLVSPDSRWILFSSDRSGAYEVWITTYPTSGPMFQVSTGGGPKRCGTGPFRTRWSTCRAVPCMRSTSARALNAPESVGRRARGSWSP